MNKAIPNEGIDYYNDMINKHISVSAKAHSARKYTEMIIDIFFSENIKKKINDEKYEKLSLKDMINYIEKDINKSLLNLLYNIKDIGDRGSHHNSAKELRESEVQKIVDDTIDNLFPLILVNHIEKDFSFFNKDRYSAKILSTLIPSIREKVLFELLDFNNKIEDRKRIVLHKYIMASCKNNNRNKVKRKLEKLHNKKYIDTNLYQALQITINTFSDESQTKVLPIAQNMADMKRNFSNVLKELNSNHLNIDRELIRIISLLLDTIESSELGDLKPDIIFHNEKL